MVTTDQPDAPAYFTYDAVLNTKERPTLDEALAREVQPIPLDSVLALQESGAQILDTREPGEFAAAHLAGSINVGLSGQYATWAGTVLRHDKPVVIVAAPGHRTRVGDAARPDRIRSGRRLPAGRPREPRRSPRADAHHRAPRPRRGGARGCARGRCCSTSARRASAFDKRIKGSLAIPLTQLEARIGEVPRDRPVIVHCAGGYRSSIAASVLARAGVDDVVGAGGRHCRLGAGAVCRWRAPSA